MSVPAHIERYRVDRRIGSGGFATVWLARDDLLDSDVAVKVLADNWTDRLDVRSRFTEEARILRRADSDHVVRVHDVGELADGRPYFVMTYADLGTLEDRLLHGPIPVGDALRFARGVARGLAVLHGLHVVHRDVKPSNVLFATRRDEPGERILIADLGLARAVAHASGFTLAAGTPGYMAPEQGVVGGSVDQRADVYGLGALLVHMLCGKRMGLVGGPPRDTPSSLAEVIEQAMRENPDERYPNGAAMARALDDVNLLPGRAPVSATTQLRRRDGPAERPRYDGRPHGHDVTSGSPAATAGSGSAEHPAVRHEPSDPAEDHFQSPHQQKSHRARWVAIVAGGVAVAAAAGVLVALNPFSRGPDPTVHDASGTVTITVPDSWAAQVNRDGFDMQKYFGVSGKADGIAAAPDLHKWQDTHSVGPGLIVGVSPKLARVDDEQLLRARSYPGCTVADERPVLTDILPTGKRILWQCPHPAVRYDVIVLRPKDSSYVVYLQIKEGAGEDRLESLLETLNIEAP